MLTNVRLMPWEVSMIVLTPCPASWPRSNECESDVSVHGRGVIAKGGRRDMIG